MIRLPWGGRHTAVFILVFFVWMSYAKIEVPVFLLSGQSNMTGYANGSALTADQKKNVDNVKIYMDLVWEGDAAKMKKWVTLGPGFGSNASNIGPELYLGRTLSDSMPGKKFALIKCCSGSTYLGKATDWLPPSSNNGTGGTLYNKMTGVIDAALKTFTTAFDTAQYTPKWAGFVWLQGEFDAYDLTLSNAYQKNLTNLINDIRSQVKVADLPVIIPMIDAQAQWTNNVIVRAAEVAVTKSLKNVDTLDTKGYPTDGTHYTAPGQVKIGTVTAQRWMKMKYISVPIADRYSFPSVAEGTTRAAPFSQSMFLDLSGRKISAANRPLSKNGILIKITTTTGNSQGYKKITVEN